MGTGAVLLSHLKSSWSLTSLLLSQEAICPVSHSDGTTTVNWGFFRAVGDTKSNETGPLPSINPWGKGKKDIYLIKMAKTC
jgi:hypothetical protein